MCTTLARVVSLAASIEPEGEGEETTDDTDYTDLNWIGFVAGAVLPTASDVPAGGKPFTFIICVIGEICGQFPVFLPCVREHFLFIDCAANFFEAKF
jgi:hypothetical protein